MCAGCGQHRVRESAEKNSEPNLRDAAPRPNRGPSVLLTFSELQREGARRAWLQVLFWLSALRPRGCLVLMSKPPVPLMCTFGPLRRACIVPETPRHPHLEPSVHQCKTRHKHVSLVGGRPTTHTQTHTLCSVTRGAACHCGSDLDPRAALRAVPPLCDKTCEEHVLDNPRSCTLEEHAEGLSRASRSGQHTVQFSSAQLSSPVPVPVPGFFIET